MPAAPPLMRAAAPRRLGAMLAAAGLASIGLLARPRQAEASYSTGTAPDGGDLVNTHLTVQGNLTATGNVGIGTTSPSLRLVIQEAGDAQIALKNSGGATKAYLGTSGVFGVGPSTDDLRIRSDAANIVFGFSGWEALRFTSTGRVGIGTTAPVAKLHVHRGSILAGVPYGDADRSDYSVHVATMQPGIPSLTLQRGGHWAVRLLVNDMSFRVRDFGGGLDGADRLAVGNSGNVGIVTTAPDARLHLGDGALKIGTRVIADGGGSFYAP